MSPPTTVHANDPLPGLKTTELGLLPDEWAVVPLA